MARLLRVDEARAPAGLISVAIVRQTGNCRVTLQGLLFGPRLARPFERSLSAF